MKSSQKAGIGVLVILILGVFGYFQYVSALDIDVNIAHSELISKTETSSKYDVKLEFKNPTLLPLTAGHTEFFIFSNDVSIGRGQLEPFILQPLDTSVTSGTFDTTSSNDKSQSIRITGVIKYNVVFATIDVPFVFYPTDEQAIEFIHHN